MAHKKLFYPEGEIVMKKTNWLAGCVCLGMSAAACASSPPPAPAEPEPEAPIEEAPLTPAAETPAEAPPPPITLSVPIDAKSKSKLKGRATFSEVEGGVMVKIEVEGVTAGDHGAHVHQIGDCSSADGKSAGDHFNPMTHDHALPKTEMRHLGDLGNLTVGKDGKGSLEITITGANLKSGDANSFDGRAIVIHAKKDDGGQPSGNAGDRIGCGVIAKAP